MQRPSIVPLIVFVPYVITAAYWGFLLWVRWDLDIYFMNDAYHETNWARLIAVTAVNLAIFGFVCWVANRTFNGKAGVGILIFSEMVAFMITVVVNLNTNMPWPSIL